HHTEPARSANGLAGRSATRSSRSSMSNSHWDQPDLAGRVAHALEMAEHALHEVGCQSIQSDALTPASAAAHEALAQKRVAESAMLLLCARPLAVSNKRLSSRLHEVAVSLLQHARGPDVASAVCSDPGRALDYAFAHVLLTRLGYPDQAFDL